MAVSEQEQVLAWWQQLRESSNSCFLPLYLDEHRYLVLCGGGGSGKSIFAGRKVLERVIHEPGHRWLVCRKVARSLRESCFQQLLGQLETHYPRCGVQVLKSEMLLRFPNGSEVLFAGLDNTEKLKSIYDITGIWVEEASEISEGDFNQLDIRLRTRSPYYLQMILSFNPVSVSHWLKKRFFDRDEPRARTHRSSYRDNRFLSPEAAETLEGFRETDPYYYTVYCLGQWGVTGRTVFDAVKLGARLQELEPPLARGLFEWSPEADEVHIRDCRWTEEAEGPVRIYAMPEPGRPYVIGADTAGDGSDWFVAQVLDNISGAQVCTLRSHYDEDSFARQLYCLGRFYGDALIGVEVNFSTYPVKLLELMGYPRLYVREVEDNYTGALRRSFGFRTDRVTRPLILGELVRWVREHPELLRDEETVQELLTFVRSERLRPEAAPGAHDDCVMALAIALHIRPQQSMELRPAAAPSARLWTEDMWEDYRSADAAGKAYMYRSWGPPKGLERFGEA